MDMSFAGPDGDVVPLNERPRLVALNKVDVPDGKDMAGFVRADLEERGYRVFEVSASSHAGLRQLGFAMAEIVEQARAAVAATPPKVEAPVLRPRGVNAAPFRIRHEEKDALPLFRVLGEKPERWVQQTDFTNDEAVGYLADRLAKVGVEEELFRIGAKPGDTVVIGEGDGVVFDWEPTMMGGAELLAGPRGTDLRLAEYVRPTREQKREEYQARKDAKAAARAELEADRKAGVWTESVQDRKRTAPARQEADSESQG